jgi:hypothetical protein
VVWANLAGNCDRLPPLGKGGRGDFQTGGAEVALGLTKSPFPLCKRGETRFGSVLARRPRSANRSRWITGFGEMPHCMLSQSHRAPERDPIDTIGFASYLNAYRVLLQKTSRTSTCTQSINISRTT